MTTENETTTAYIDTDAVIAQMHATHGAAIRSARTSVHLDPKAMAEKWEDVESLLMPHQFKQVVEGWTLEGWNIEPADDADSLYRLRATIHFRHAEHVGYDASYEWAVDGGQKAYEWLEGIGFPFGEVEAVLV